jgi:hypothetical protein
MKEWIAECGKGHSEEGQNPAFSFIALGSSRGVDHTIGEKKSGRGSSVAA